VLLNGCDIAHRPGDGGVDGPAYARVSGSHIISTDSHVSSTAGSE
jgi:hypothetical protein